MKCTSTCGRETVTLPTDGNAEIFESHFPAPPAAADALVLASLKAPIGQVPLREAAAGRRAGEVVIVVSDITRPIPYRMVLPPILGELQAAGVGLDEVTLLVATGMHRESTPEERDEMFGPKWASRLRIVDHRAEALDELAALPTPSWSGARVRLNARYVNAGFKIITGLVEPHFMAGFSGGRKAVCPGLASLETLRNFHGHAFLSDARAANGILDGNPLHEEALSVARLAGVDFSVNVVLDGQRQVVASFAGELDAAHRAACGFAASCNLKKPAAPADVVVTSCGGHPLDTTFYQCVKGIVSCLPALKPNGVLIAFAGVSEGLGGPEFTDVLTRYGRSWRDFLGDIAKPGIFTKDQWQWQMLGRALAQVGPERLHFVTPGLDAATLARMPLTGHAVAKEQVQGKLFELVKEHLPPGGRLALFPEGPYCGAV